MIGLKTDDRSQGVGLGTDRDRKSVLKIGPVIGFGTDQDPFRVGHRRPDGLVVSLWLAVRGRGLRARMLAKTWPERQD